MTLLAAIQADINFGLGQAAGVLGSINNWYRAADATAPITTGNLRGTPTCLYQMPGTSNFSNPSLYGKAEWWGLFDPTNMLPGDYLVDPNLGIFFIASIEPLHYPLLVRCNAMASIARPGAATPGAGYYGGDDTATETPLLTGWPISLLAGVKGNDGEVRIPGDLRLPWAIILMPASSGVLLKASDQLTTTDSQIFTLASCEQTARGWRLTASLANP